MTDWPVASSSSSSEANVGAAERRRAARRAIGQRTPLVSRSLSPASLPPLPSPTSPAGRPSPTNDLVSKQRNARYFLAPRLRKRADSTARENVG